MPGCMQPERDKRDYVFDRTDWACVSLPHQHCQHQMRTTRQILLDAAMVRLGVSILFPVTTFPIIIVRRPRPTATTPEGTR
jgi:hypothetical protein